MTKFNIGDVVYHATAGQEHIWITCPECLGSGRLRVILGDESQVSIACVCCGRGDEGSPGKIQTYAFRAEAEAIIITGIETYMRNDEVQEKYKFDGCYSADGNDLFATREEALTRAIALATEHEADETKRLKYKEKQHKTWAWHVSYWRSQIRHAKEEIARYEARLAVAPKSRIECKEADKLES